MSWDRRPSVWGKERLCGVRYNSLPGGEESRRRTEGKKGEQKGERQAFRFLLKRGPLTTKRWGEGEEGGFFFDIRRKSDVLLASRNAGGSEQAKGGEGGSCPSTGKRKPPFLAKKGAPVSE